MAVVPPLGTGIESRYFRRAIRLCTTRHQAKVGGCYCGMRIAYESFVERPQDLVERLASSLVIPGVFFVPSSALRWLRHRSFAQPKRSSTEQRELHHHTAK